MVNASSWMPQFDPWVIDIDTTLVQNKFQIWNWKV